MESVTEERNNNMPSVVAKDFYLWLLWQSATSEGRFDVTADKKAKEREFIELWPERRIVLRAVNGSSSVVLTGNDAPYSQSLKSALIEGKYINEVEFRIVQDNRSYVFTLSGPEIHVTNISLPQEVAEGNDDQNLESEGAVRDRMWLYNHLTDVINVVFYKFALERTSGVWEVSVSLIREWVLKPVESVGESE